MRVISRFTQRIWAFGAGLSIALVFAIILVNSVRRYTTGHSLAWGEEMPIYLTIYGVMFGIGLAYLQDRHIRFSIVTDILTDQWRRWTFAAMDLVTLATGIGLTLSGIAFASRRPQIEASGLIGTAKELAQSLDMAWLEWLGRVGTWQAAIACGGIILAISAAIRFIERIQEKGDA
ncbi:TRAP transporter small permease subunit [Cohaesibacter sp. CAU 1516]|uniref:TRAP transporter small permease n=1 Tax=Cohaesibacter sp. CAU 1516 TaxID=2576038 RepID=UPI0010FE8E2E|nr:TRAP transporter small permease subunit [Cohaesibacter sp. CAU 1516]TLP48395.1 TRAP transporter small permease subunit [Cohaesibacter sp. CAU 1516]